MCLTGMVDAGCRSTLRPTSTRRCWTRAWRQRCASVVTVFYISSSFFKHTRTYHVDRCDLCLLPGSLYPQAHAGADGPDEQRPRCCGAAPSTPVWGAHWWMQGEWVDGGSGVQKGTAAKSVAVRSERQATPPPVPTMHAVQRTPGHSSALTSTTLATLLAARRHRAQAHQASRPAGPPSLLASKSWTRRC